MTNIFACYEEWLENIFKLFKVTDLRNKVICFQNPTSKSNNYHTQFAQLTVDGNADLINAFYGEDANKNKHYDYSKLNNWLLLYRYYKECRNAIIHNGGQTTDRVINAYSHISGLTATDLNVLEIPQSFATLINEPIRLSLRGVVGLSLITIKIVSTLDVELIKAKYADEYFVNRILDEVMGCQTLSSKNIKKTEASLFSSIKRAVSKTRRHRLCLQSYES